MHFEVSPASRTEVTYAVCIIVHSGHHGATDMYDHYIMNCDIYSDENEYYYVFNFSNLHYIDYGATHDDHSPN